jgi:hypothetical protein
MPAAWNTLLLRNIVFEGKRFDFVLERDASGQVRAMRRTASTE